MTTLDKLRSEVEFVKTAINIIEEQTERIDNYLFMSDEEKDMDEERMLRTKLVHIRNGINRRLEETK